VTHININKICFLLSESSFFVFSLIVILHPGSDLTESRSFSYCVQGVSSYSK